MSETADTARNDLAFMKAVVEDRGPLTGVFGAHLFWPGLIFGLNFIYIWAIAAERAPWPFSGLSWAWVPGAVIYGLVAIYLWRRFGGVTLGPSARGFAAAWSTVGAMSAASVSVLLIASARTGHPFYEAWPSLAFVIYGGCWMAGAVIRRRRWLAIVAAVSFGAASLSAWRIEEPDMWLVNAAGVLLCVAVPGAVILRLASMPKKRN